MGMDRKEGGGSLLVWPPLLFFLNVFNRLQIWDGFHSITSCVLLQCSCAGIAPGPAHLDRRCPRSCQEPCVACPGPCWAVSPSRGGLLSVHSALCVHPQPKWVWDPSFKPSSDPQKDISEIRCTVPEILLVLVADEIAKVYRDTVGVLVVLFESFWGVNHWSVWVPQTHR